MPMRRSRRPKQLEIEYRTWGGRRDGAGRKPNGKRAGVSHLRRERLASRHPVSVTIRVLDHVPSLRQRDPYDLICSALEAVSRRDDFRVVEFSVQSNHLHLIVEAHSAEALARGMQALSIRIAKALNRLTDRRGRVFADRYHARILRTPRAVRFALRYVLNNRRKHRDIELPPLSPTWIDSRSSAQWFDGWSTGDLDLSAFSRAELAMDRFLPAPRTWLLRDDWRRHGPIHPSSVPGRPKP